VAKMNADEAVYIDIKITNNEIELDAAGIPIEIYDRDVIAQDLVHSIKESGLLQLLIGERNPEYKHLTLKKIRMLMESDTRIEPGSSSTKFINNNTLRIGAGSEFGPILNTVIL
jgi:hypothetical protein